MLAHESTTWSRSDRWPIHENTLSCSQIYDEWITSLSDIIKSIVFHSSHPSEPKFTLAYQCFQNRLSVVVVNNFQSIRNDLFVEVKEIHDREKRDNEMEQFAEELAYQNQLR